MIKDTVLEKTFISKGFIFPALSVEQMRERLAQGEVFICKNVFKRERIKKVVQAIFQKFFIIGGKKTIGEWTTLPPQSKIRKCLAQYFAFIWNSEVPEIFEISRMIGQLRNKVAGLPLDFGFAQKDKFWVIPII